MILLFLMIVAQLPLPLSCHPALRLGHLIGIVGSRRIALVLVEALDVGRRVGSASVVLAHGVMALGACQGQWLSPGRYGSTSHTMFGVRTGISHGHRLTTAGPRLGGPEFPALGEVVGSTFDFCNWTVSLVFYSCSMGG